MNEHTSILELIIELLKAIGSGLIDLKDAAANGAQELLTSVANGDTEGVAAQLPGAAEMPAEQLQKEVEEASQAIQNDQELSNAINYITGGAGLAAAPVGGKLWYDSKKLGDIAKRWEDGIKKAKESGAAGTPENADAMAKLYTDHANEALNAKLLGAKTNKLIQVVPRISAVVGNPTNPSQWTRNGNGGLNAAINHYDTYANTNDPRITGTHQLVDVLKDTQRGRAQEHLDWYGHSLENLPPKLKEAIESGRGANYVRQQLGEYMGTLTPEQRAEGLRHVVGINNTMFGDGYVDAHLNKLLQSDMAGNTHKKNLDIDPLARIRGEARRLLTEPGTPTAQRIANFEDWLSGQKDYNTKKHYEGVSADIHKALTSKLTKHDGKAGAIAIGESAAGPLRGAVRNALNAPEDLQKIIRDTESSFADKLSKAEELKATSSNPEIHKGVDAFKSLVTGEGSRGGLSAHFLDASKHYARDARLASRLGKGLGAATVLAGPTYAAMQAYNMLKSGSTLEKTAGREDDESRAMRRLTAAKRQYQGLIEQLMNPQKNIVFTAGRNPKIGRGHEGPATNMRKLIEFDPRFAEEGARLYDVITDNRQGILEKGIRVPVIDPKTGKVVMSDEIHTHNPKTGKIEISHRIDPLTGEPVLKPLYTFKTDKNGNVLLDTMPTNRDYNITVNTGMGDASSNQIWGQAGQDGEHMVDKDRGRGYGKVSQTVQNVIMDLPSKENGLGATQDDQGLGYTPQTDGYSNKKENIKHHVKFDAPLADEIHFVGGSPISPYDDSPLSALIREGIAKNKAHRDKAFSSGELRLPEDSQALAAMQALKPRRYLERLADTQFLKGTELGEWLKYKANDNVRYVGTHDTLGSITADPEMIENRRKLLNKSLDILKKNPNASIRELNAPLVAHAEQILSDPAVKLDPGTRERITKIVEHAKAGKPIITVQGAGRGDYVNERAIALMDELSRRGESAKDVMVLNMHGNPYNDTVLKDFAGNEAALNDVRRKVYGSIEAEAAKRGLGGRFFSVGLLDPRLFQLAPMLSNANTGSSGNLSFTETATGGAPSLLPKEWWDFQSGEWGEDGKYRDSTMENRMRALKNIIQAATGSSLRNIDSSEVRTDQWNRGNIDASFGTGAFKGRIPSKIFHELKHYDGSYFTPGTPAYEGQRASARRILGALPYATVPQDSLIRGDIADARRTGMWDAEDRRHGDKLLDKSRDYVERLRARVERLGNRLSPESRTSFNKAYNFYDNIDNAAEQLVGQRWDVRNLVDMALDTTGEHKRNALVESMRNIEGVQKGQKAYLDYTLKTLRNNAFKTRVGAGLKLGAGAAGGIGMAAGLSAPIIGAFSRMHDELNR